MGMIVGICIALIIALLFFDYMLDLEIPGVIYTFLILGYIFYNIFTYGDDTTPPPQEITISAETKQEVAQLKSEVKQEMQEIRNGVAVVATEMKQSVKSLSVEVENTDEAIDIQIIITCVLFFIVLIWSESVFVGIFVAALAFSFLDNNLVVNGSQEDTSTTNSEKKQVNTTNRKYDVEYMSNGHRHKTPVYLYTSNGETTATSNPESPKDAAITFTPKRLVKHTSGQLFACRTSKQCYPVRVYE